MIMKSAVQPVEAPPAREPVSTATNAAKAQRLTMPVILMINGVILLTLGLILYFALRTPPATPAPSGGTVPTADSAASGGADGGAAPKDSAAR